MAEGYDPSQYHQQAQNAEAYRLNMERLENQEALQHRIKTRPIGKVRSILLAILAVAMVAVGILATAAICAYPILN